MEKEILARFQQKHDIEANWQNATDFIPKAGEIIVYDTDDTHDQPRIKIGNGVDNVNVLTFMGKDFDILPIDRGGTGNVDGYIRTGAKEGTVIGDRATAEGSETQANGGYSHAEGYSTTAEGVCSHSEGRYTYSKGAASHAEGNSAQAVGDYSHAEGDGTKAIGLNSHAEGKGAEAHGADSHAEGRYAKAYGEGSHAEGNNSEAHELFSHAEGYRTRARGVYSHAEGDCAEANGRQSHAEGASTKALGSASHAEGNKTEANQYASHAEGSYSKATGGAAHAEGGHYKVFQEDGTYTEMGGDGTLASGNSSHAEGASTIASGNFSHASGYGTKASGEASYAAGTGQQEWSGTCTGNGTTTLTYTSGPSKTLNVGDTLVFKYTADALKSRECKIVSKLSSTQYELDDDLDSGVTYNVYRLVYNEASGKGARSVGEGTTASGNFSIAEGYKTTAQGNYSHAEGLHSKVTVEGAHAEGYQTEATGKYAHSEGRTAKAQGYCSHAEGFGTTVSKDYGHAEGNTTKAEGRSAHAEGEGTTASGKYSHAEGYGTTASKDYSHAEGDYTTASGDSSHAEGHKSMASGLASHAEGSSSSSGEYSHAEGDSTVASGSSSHSEGAGTRALGSASHAEGKGTEAHGEDSHAEGRYAKAYGTKSHAEGESTVAEGPSSHAEGIETKAIANGSHAEGFGTTTLFDVSENEDNSFYDGETGSILSRGQGSHAEGVRTNSKGIAAHAEGVSSKANGLGSHAEGYYTTASRCSHAEGYRTTSISTESGHIEGHSTKQGSDFNAWQQAVLSGQHDQAFSCVAGDGAHVEGADNYGLGHFSHAEGRLNVAYSMNSHAEGLLTQALGDESHTEGTRTIAYSAQAHAGGSNTTVGKLFTNSSGIDNVRTGEYAKAAFAHGIGLQASAPAQAVFGKYNEESEDALFIVGNGSSANDRSNAFVIKANNAHAEGQGTVAIGQASHAEGCMNLIKGERYKSGEVYGSSTLKFYNDQDFPEIKINSPYLAYLGDVFIGLVMITTLSSYSSSFKAYYYKSNFTLEAGKSYDFYATAAFGASGKASHTEGVSTSALGEASHAEGSMGGLGGTYLGTGWFYSYSNTFQSYGYNVVFDPEEYMYSADFPPMNTVLTLSEDGVTPSDVQIRLTVITDSYNPYRDSPWQDYEYELISGTLRDGSYWVYIDPVVTQGPVSFGKASHAEGISTHANADGCHAEGKYNIEDTSKQYIHITGIGSAQNRANGFTINMQGKGSFASTVATNGADYAEHFEWLDGNPNNEDRIGYMVTLEGDKIKFANEEDDVIGIISGTAAILGDNAEWEWKQKYVTDEFGRIVYEHIPIYEYTEDEETHKIIATKIDEEIRPKLSPEYDPSKPYVARSDRPEWGVVGMFGKLYVRDDGTSLPNQYLKVGNGGIGVNSSSKTNMRVLRRVSENIVQILFT